MANKKEIQDLALQIKALSHSRRLQMLSHLKKHKTATVGELAEAVDIHIQSASQHLRLLRLAKIVKSIRRGKFVAYRISLKQEEVVKGILRRL